MCWLMLAVPSISLLQASWLLWVAAGIVLNASLQWKHLFPGVLQDALHYGKLKLDVRGGGQTLGLLNVPKSWFTHFYAWGVLWNFTVFYHCVSVCIYNKPPTVPYMESALTFLSGLHVEEECHTPGLTQQHFDTLMAMALICLQVSRRLYECLFVSVFSKSKMHFLHYVLGIYFYTALGPTALLHIAPRPSRPERTPVATELWSLVHWYHIVGLSLFVWASVHQHRCHKILANLRTRRNNSDHSYHLPKGDWFEYVSSPHYLAEVLIYMALLVFFAATDWGTNWWLVVAFTTSTLLLSARQVHLWYKLKFKDHPTRWKIIIPGLY